jgi:radical SAM protein with 4Fe4S-binding SPASM domain
MRTLRNIVHLFRILVDYRRRAETVGTLPIRLWVETSGICNLRCLMCPNKDMSPGEKTLMDLDLFKKIVDEARGSVNDMYLHHRGEPFTNPALFDMIAYARTAGIRTRFHSNGSLMDAVKTEKLLKAGPDLISFSVDGVEKALYEKVRIGATFEKTLENIFRLLEMRKAMSLKRPYVVIEKIRFLHHDVPENQDRVAALWKRFLDAGADEVIEKDEYIWAGENSPEPKAPRNCSICTYPWYAMVICADGTVTPCSQDFWAAMNMGNARTQGLREIWNGTPYRDLRRRFRTANVDSLPLCRKCDRLHRKTIGGLPFQYMVTFLVDQLVGYNRLRRMIGTGERNS